MSERLSPADRAGALALHHALGSAVEASIAKELREAILKEREENILAIKTACDACKGTGGVLAHDGSGDEIACEYCGRPVAAIRARGDQ